MTDNDAFEAWKQERRLRDEVPQGFAERVMGAARTRSQRQLAAGLLGVVLLRSRWSRVALCSVGFALYLFRVGQVVAVLFVH